MARIDATKSLHPISLIAVVTGLLLVAAPWWWPSLVGGKNAWSEAQAKEYSQAAAQYHRLAHDGKTSAGAQEALAKYNRQRTALDQARTAGQSAATIMRCVGIAAIAAGLFGWAATNRPSLRSENDLC